MPTAGLKSLIYVVFVGTLFMLYWLKMTGKTLETSGFKTADQSFWLIVTPPCCRLRCRPSVYCGGCGRSSNMAQAISVSSAGQRWNFLPAEVGVHVREAVVLSQGQQNAGRAAAVPLAAEAAVTYASAGGARPLLHRQGGQILQSSLETSQSLYTAQCERKRGNSL